MSPGVGSASGVRMRQSVKRWLAGRKQQAKRTVADQPEAEAPDVPQGVQLELDLWTRPSLEEVLPAVGDTTLAEARRHLIAHLDEGVHCPCCDQYARRYKRKLNSGMVRALLWLVQVHRQGNGDWVDVQVNAPAWLLRTKQLPTTRYWGLVERAPNDASTRKSSGQWRPTDLGIRFAFGDVRVPRHVYVYNDVVEAFSAERTDVIEALGDRFSYSELMAWTGDLS